MIPQQTGRGESKKKERKRKEKHPQPDAQAGIPDVSANDRGTLNNGVLNRMLTPVHDERYDLLLFFANVKPTVIQFLRTQIEQQQGIKWYLSTQIEMYKENPDGSVEIDKPHFKSITYRASSKHDLDETDVNQAFQNMSASLDSYIRNS